MITFSTIYIITKERLIEIDIYYIIYIYHTDKKYGFLVLILSNKIYSYPSGLLDKTLGRAKRVFPYCYTLGKPSKKLNFKYGDKA